MLNFKRLLQKHTHSTGQSTVELLVALAIFVLVISSMGFLLLDTYVFDRDAEERMQGLFLASEGIEAVRSMRDNGWGGLPGADGDYCIGLVLGGWAFTGNAPCALLGKFERKVHIEGDTADPLNKKRVSSTVSWDFSEGDFRSVSLFTLLTNWR